jgi:menaquinone-dependent protoporphyrinogen oxidase
MNTSPTTVLVAYATKAGSTGEIAARVAEVLTKSGLVVELAPVEKVADIAPFGAVVLGSAIHAGRLLPGATRFIGGHKAALSEKSFAVFIVCMAMKERSKESQAKAGAYLDPVRAQVKLVGEGMFAGVMDTGRLGLVERTLMKAMKAPPGDFRDWAEVEGWALALATTLGSR